MNKRLQMDCIFHQMKFYLRIVGIRGLIYTVLSKIMKTLTVLKIKKTDIKFPLYLRVPSSDVYSYEQVFIFQEYDFVTRNTPKIIVDAGAFIGLVSINLSNRFPDSKIIAIEPEESNFRILKKNIAPYGNIIPIQGAIWDENKEINVVDRGLGKWGYVTQVETIAEKGPGRSCHRVMGMTIDRIMKEHGIEFIDILKIDIESAEREVFRDPSCWIEKVDTLMVELHDRMKPGCSRNFYNATNDFKYEWLQGRTVYLTRSKGCVAAPPGFAAEIFQGNR